MRVKMEAADFFNRIATTLELKQEDRILAWDILTKTGFADDEFMSVMFMTFARMGVLNKEISELFAKLPEDIREAVTDDLKAEVEKALASVPDNLAAKVDEALKASLDQLATNVDIMAQKEADRRQTFRMAQIAGGCAVIVLVALGSGYFAGRETITAEALRMEQLMQRPDATAMMTLSKFNDFNRIIAECGVGQFEFRGAAACRPNVMVSKAMVTSEGINDFFLTVTRWIVSLGTWGLLGVGGLIGLVVGRFWGSRRRA
ncbi:hypothetical protein HFN60_30125 [Rhizobium leguminosarum]|uniref:hypothetical protein n=1 Tax=Rhizobium leguminosarum TaxID=384 RepID=UPI001C9573EA|nr:hypothetical protein [Rhizobium leguminosarum]MBY5819852.1 hypothetical protein [Rhizobium leguminosarum]